MLAAGDTFRAAAVEQLQVWGERNRIPVIAQHTGADSASVIFDAVQAAKARGIDVLIADTAGRLHTKDNLMEELKKVRRVIGKLDETAPHEVLLVLDAGTGQNAINQAKQFNLAVELTGLALTKLDGTAKGGVIFALAKRFGLPIRYIGVGEGSTISVPSRPTPSSRHSSQSGRTHDPLRAGRQTLSQWPRRPARGVLPRAPWRDPLRHRPLRRRQEHPAAPHPGDGATDQRQAVARRPGPGAHHHRADPFPAPADRRGVPEPPTAHRSYGGGQHRPAAADPRHAQAGDRQGAWPRPWSR